MSSNQSLLNQLEQLLSHKKGKKFYAERLGVTESKINELLTELKNKKLDHTEDGSFIEELEESVIKFFEDLEKGTGEIVFNTNEEIKSLAELILKCKIDTEKWEVTKYIQNYWGNKKNPHWQVKAWLGVKKEEQLFQESFVDFLGTYQPAYEGFISPKFFPKKVSGNLIINKQDSHLNKFDIDGNNNIAKRLDNILFKTEVIVSQAQLSNNLDKITYIIGSDEFNSEFTNMTTKGTPQQNTHSHHESFEFICDHEVAIITMLLQHANNIDVIFVSGNHDEFAGWYMIKWLEGYFRTTERVSFDISPKYRKYVSYGNTALMFNHGDVLKPVKLAALFPMEYRENWSSHENFYIFTGDKHHEVSLDLNGIKFYQLPALSTSKSLWDDKNGHVMSKAEITGFLIDEFDGLTNIFKQYL
jgi:hypothetical protein